MRRQRLYVFCASAGIILLLSVRFSQAQGDPKSNPGHNEGIRVHEAQSAGGVTLLVENLNWYDATVTLTVRSRNARIMRYKTQTDTYPGKSKTQALFMHRDDKEQPWSWRYHIRWVKGDIHAQHDEYVLYRLPFQKKKSFRVLQSYHGRFSHQGSHEYTVDFAMPEGMSVCAAREGVVVDTQGRFEEGGAEDSLKHKSNYVTIAHGDGTLGEYHHLKYQGVLVEVGQAVSAGDVIGLSGNTGYSSVPHLHFGVYSPKDGRTMQSYPVAFRTAQGVIREPVRRRHYTVPE
jgi:murein DD-endopeptidase MepM/ murein hydrolase activator NlpD